MSDFKLSTITAFQLAIANTSFDSKIPVGNFSSDTVQKNNVCSETSILKQLIIQLIPVPGNKQKTNGRKNWKLKNQRTEKKILFWIWSLPITKYLRTFTSRSVHKLLNIHSGFVVTRWSWIRRVWLVIGWVTVCGLTNSLGVSHLGELSLAIPAWFGAFSAGISRGGEKSAPRWIGAVNSTYTDKENAAYWGISSVIMWNKSVMMMMMMTSLCWHH